MPFGNAVGEGFVNPGIDTFTVGVPPNVQLTLESLSGVGALIVTFNDPRFHRGGLAGDVQGNFAQIFINGPVNNAPGHGDLVGVEFNSSDGTGSANFILIYTDASGTPHTAISVDNNGVHVSMPLQINGGSHTLPLAHDANFPVSGAATLATVITALNALYADLVTGQVFAS